MSTNDRDYTFRNALISRCIRSFVQSLIASCIVLLAFDDFGIFRVFIIAIVSAIVTFVGGAVFGVPEGETAGTLYIDTNDESTDRYLMDFDNIDGLKTKKKVQIKIRTDKRLSQDPKYIGED